jgi:hypothetical protein
MSRTTRVLLIALLVGLCFFLPTKSHAIERDPYLIRTLVARIQLEYEKISLTENGRKASDESRFKQIYSLETRGNLLSRYLIIYDAGVSFSDNDYTSGATNFVTNEYDYNLRTTFLPKSAIPLTLYGRYSTQTVSGLQDDFWHSRLLYGLSWFSTIKPFPRTLLTVERVNDKTDTTDVLSTYVRVRADKEIGPTENQVEYVYQNSDDQKSSNLSTSSDVNLRNKTHLSKNTAMYIGATRSESEITEGTSGTSAEPLTTQITLQGLAMSLTSRPSQEFNQSHNYTYFSNKSTTGRNTGSHYSGDMDYSFSDRLRSHLGLAYSESKDETGTSEFKNQTISTGDSISYSLNSNLSISETISYTKTTTNASEGTLANVGDRSSLRVTTALAYRKPLSFANLTSNYALSYIEDNLVREVGREGGKGIEQDVSAGLSDINVVPHVGFDTFARYITIKNLSGDIGGSGYNYEANAYNRSLRKYVKILGTYSKEKTASWIALLEQKRELYRLNVSSDYFRNTSIRANAEHVNNFNNISGFTSTSSQSLSADHRRPLLGGSLFLAASFHHFTTHSTGEPQKVFLNLYEAKYSRAFLKSLLWQLRLFRSERTDQATFTNTSSIENGIFMPLRSWLFSLEHRYTLTEDYQRERTENRFMFRASRMFFRVY